MGDVGGALNEGAAVGEDGDGVGRALEAEQEAVGADRAEGSELCGERGEVDGARVLVNLYRVAAAERDVRAAFAGKIAEVSIGADIALGVGCGGGDFGAGVAPEVVGQERAPHLGDVAGEELERFGGLQRGCEVDGGGKNAGGVAGFDDAGGWGGEEAGEAGEAGVGNRE